MQDLVGHQHSPIRLSIESFHYLIIERDDIMLLLHYRPLIIFPL